MRRPGATGTGRRGALRPLLAALLAGLAAGAAPAAEEPAAGKPAADEAAEAAPPAPPPFPDELDRQTPRGSMHGYLAAGLDGEWKRAARYLDLRALPESERKDGPALARRLKIVLDRVLWVDLDRLSAEPEGDADDGLPPGVDRVGSVDTPRGAVDILLERVPREDGKPVWEIARSTVARIPVLYDAHGYGRLGDLLPPIFFAHFGLKVQLWQWIALLAVLLFAYLGSWLAARAALAMVRPAVARSRTQVDDRLLEVVAPPVRLLAAVLLFAAAVLAIGLSPPAQRVFTSIEQALGVVAVTWLVLRLVDVLSGVVERKLPDPRVAQSLVPLGRRAVQVAIVALATLAALDSFGFDVTALIAGLGVGGIAVALAAQKTIENLFGGATLIADRPVRVGDFCRFGDKLGTIEEIGMRSTRVRTLDRTVVTVPNAEFASLQLESFAARDRIWYHPTIGLLYDTTPDQLRYVLVEIRRMLYAHPKVDPDPARVRFVGFGASSLDLEIFAYVRTPDYNEYLEVAEDLNLRIMDIVAEAGTAFAFPSTTAYLAKDAGVDEERAREAEAEVGRWREQKELYLPGFPPERIDALRGTLDFPNEGSPQHMAREKERRGEE